MKTALTLGLLLVSVLASVAKADVKTFALGAPQLLGNQTNVSRNNVYYCPDIKSMSVTTEEGSMKVESVLLTFPKQVSRLDNPIESTTCISDVVCPTEDLFTVDRDTTVTLKHKNDGQYPTHNLEGYTTLEVTMKPLPNQSITCAYEVR